MRAERFELFHNADHFAAARPELVVREAPLELPSVEICMAWHPTFAADPALVWLREVVARVLAGGHEGGDEDDEGEEDDDA